jgi:anti-anti-sigma factor
MGHPAGEGTILSVVEDQPYESTYDEGQRLLSVSGTIGETTGPQFREDIETHSDEFTRPLDVDLSGVDFFPSLAVGVLAVALRRSREAGTELGVLAREGSIAARVLTICGLPYTQLPTE